MPSLRFPEPFTHQHPPVRSVNEIFEEHFTFGQRAADRVATVIGSWRFVIAQSVLLAVWAALNVTAWAEHWDPYPFILMNLFLSLQAAYTAPVLMMSQNRQAYRDRIEARVDYEINEKAEVEIRAILDHLSAQDEALREIYELLGELRSSMKCGLDTTAGAQ
jgi:uncharacterized membrane protein